MPRESCGLIACETVIKEMQHLAPPGLKLHAVRSGLHLKPDKLKGEIQNLIDDMTGATDRIILGFGRCSMATLGLRAAESTLVIPRVDDCIALFLGSMDSYRHQHGKAPGTYYLSRGWIDAGITLVEEFRETEERLSRRAADIVKRRMLANYSRLAFINMGDGGQAGYRDFSKRAALELGLAYDEINGTPRLLEKMINGPWDDEFVIASPGHTVALSDFEKHPS